MNTVDPELLKPPTIPARDFLRKMIWFSVGVGAGLAPYLGMVKVPGFRPLLNIMPLQIRFELISLSAFLLGIVALAVEFYAAERVSRRFLRWAFAPALIVMLVGFFLFVTRRHDFTVGVPRGGTKVTVLYSPEPLDGCPCENPANKIQCIKDLGLHEASLALCWDGPEFNRRGLVLGMYYLMLTGGFGGLVGLVVLQTIEERRRAEARAAREAKERETRERETEKAKRPPKRRRRKAAAPAPPAGLPPTTVPPKGVPVPPE